MAVQLARLSLWLATLAADRPLSFLDHRLQVGDSLLGAWLAHLRHAAVDAHVAARPTTRCRCSTMQPSPTALREALPIRFSLEATPNDTLEQVRAKERALAGLTGARRRAVALEAGRRISGAPRGSPTRRTPRPRRRSERCPTRR